MSKERELLQRLVDSGVLGGYSFIKEVKALLAQPEQTEQEPIYIVGKGWQCDEMPAEGVKLYTSPQKT